MTVNTEKLQKFCEKALINCGLKPEVAQAVAESAVRTDMLGITTHGTVNLAKYVVKMRAGGINGKAQPEVLSDGPTWARLSGNHGFGMYNARYAMDMAMEKAEKMGMALVTITDSAHCGACSAYSVYAAEKGFLAIAMSNTVKLMCVPGGKGSVIGNAPISYALPRKDAHPIFMDIALSQVAKLKVIQYQKEGKPVPQGWVVDADGVPTTTPQGNEYSLLPVGAHKGYCLAFLVEALTTVLSGGSFDIRSWLTAGQETHSNLGHTMLVIDVKKMIDPMAFAQRLEEYTNEIVNAPKAKGSDKIFYPGEPNWQIFDKAKTQGLELPEATRKALYDLAELAGLNFEEEMQ